MPERMNGERLCYLASMARWTEVKEMALDLLDARRERDEARPVLEAVRRLNAARFADWTDYHLEDSLGWALKWGPAEWEAEVSAVIAIRAVAAARAAAKEVG